MYLGVNFDGGTYNLGDGAGDLPMLLDGYPMIASGSAGESWSVTVEKVYEIIADYFLTLVLYQPKKGQTVLVNVPVGGNSGSAWAWFRVDSVNVQREGSQIIKSGLRDGKPEKFTIIQVRATLNLTFLTAQTERYTFPWDLPPYNFKLGTELLEQSAWDFLNTGKDGWATEREPFVNTAGVPLQATVTRPLVRMSFSFNLAGIDPNWVHIWTGKVNSDGVMICGIWFEPGMVKLESLNFEICEDTPPAAGDQEPEPVEYFKCDVSLLIDPQKFERQYLNVGTHIMKGGALRRLWCARHNGGVTYGSLDDVAGYENPEEVSENMFLNEDGDGIEGFTDDGRQTPTYRTGYLEQTCPFSAENGGIGLPEEPPFNRPAGTRPEQEP